MDKADRVKHILINDFGLKSDFFEFKDWKTNTMNSERRKLWNTNITLSNKVFNSLVHVVNYSERWYAITLEIKSENKELIEDLNYYLQKHNEVKIILNEGGKYVFVEDGLNVFSVVIEYGRTRLTLAWKLLG